MIQITNGNFQTANGTKIANGTLVLQLSQDASVIATPGQIVAAIPIRVPLDATGNISGTVNIWSNAELSPSTTYEANILDANGANVWSVAQKWYLPNSSPLDVGTLTPAITNPGSASV